MARLERCERPGFPEPRSRTPHSPAMARKLKVYRMAAGFEDAYVAAPSRKAALAAWGSEHDQFARGNAEEITDTLLMREPLANPGKVIRASRGDLAAQLKAVPRKPANARKTSSRSDRAKVVQRSGRSVPPPTREKLDAAESALQAASKAYTSDVAALAAERDAIDARIAALQARSKKDLAKLTRARDRARDDYRTKLEKWAAKRS